MTAREHSTRHHKGLAGFFMACWSQVWRTLVGGLLVWIPLIITAWLTWFVVNTFVFGIERFLRSVFLSVNLLADRYPALSFMPELRYPFGLGIGIAAVLFLATGILSRILVGRKIIALGEKIVRVIPLVNRIYNAVQQIRDVFIGRKGAVFQKVCLVEYPRQGMLAVAFVTSQDQGLVQTVVGKELVAVFVPTTPNPTSGYLIYLPEEEIQVIDMSVEEAMKLIVSGGAYVPGLAEQILAQQAKAREERTP